MQKTMPRIEHKTTVTIGTTIATMMMVVDDDSSSEAEGVELLTTDATGTGAIEVGGGKVASGDGETGPAVSVTD